MNLPLISPDRTQEAEKKLALVHVPSFVSQTGEEIGEDTGQARCRASAAHRVKALTRPLRPGVSSH
jgi:hypothetical protein